ncbi:MAG: YfhO family protein, partial [Deltaproteobacteria bacterium]|nr:YfhO family protein [Deltaproteobacteria bacterium]
LWVAGTGLVWLSEPLPEQAPALAALLRSELDGAPTRLLRDDELDRLWMHRDEVGARQNAVRLVENLRPNGGMEHGVHYLRGYGAGGLAASERLASAASEHPELLGQALAVSRVISALERKNPLIDRLVAQGLLGEIAASRPLDLRIFEVVGTRGMLHLDPETPVEAETCLLDGRVSRCRAAAPCPAATSAAGAGAATGKVQVTSYAPGEIRAEVEVTGECTVLLVADSFYPGWQAWVDGRETEIRRAHGALKAIRLAGGAHRIELRFTTNGFLTGLAISCFSLLIIAGALLASWRRGPRQAGPEVGA